VAPVNATCPYSGKPVASDSLMELGGRVIGFCNPVCRDKTVVDPEAWPEAMALLA
jgi:glutathione S-transferase